MILLSLKLKDFNLLFTYIQRILNNISIWEHKRFLLFFFSIFSSQFGYYFDKFNIIGLKILIKGKVSAAGNQRKRKILLVLGKTSPVFLKAKVYTLNKLWSTTTGALGFRVWLLHK